MLCRTASVFFLLALALSPRSVLAQDTREGLLAEQRAEKAKALKPYEGGRLERALLWFEATDPIRRLAPHDGFYVQYGYKWKPVGGGLGIGAGWRHTDIDYEAGEGIERRLMDVAFSGPRVWFAYSW